MQNLNDYSRLFVALGALGFGTGSPYYPVRAAEEPLFRPPRQW